MRAVSHKDLADDAARGVLDLFAIGSDNHHAVGDDCARNLNGCGKAADDAEEQGDDSHPAQKVTANGASVGVCRVHLTVGNLSQPLSIR
ncbi:hypothetical protein D9M68_249690 [compost metagenome]